MIGMGVLAFGIDAGWYAIVAVFFEEYCKESTKIKPQLIDRIVGSY